MIKKSSTPSKQIKKAPTPTPTPTAMAITFKLLSVDNPSVIASVKSGGSTNGPA